ncbi:MAG: addiction module toxin RelE [Syntrophaceae bacterium]|nr:addiction module toxin RelE [Syntrophaceae bacterium]
MNGFTNNTALPYSSNVEFIEASVFSKRLYEYLSEEEYWGLQNFLVQYPQAGKVIAGSGGVRKLRWRTSGKGKRGGLRVIYYFKGRKKEIWLLTIYGKSEIENIPAHILRKIAKELEDA